MYDICAAVYMPDSHAVPMLAAHSSARAPPAAHTGHETLHPKTSISVHSETPHLPPLFFLRFA
jgi:hypothetical protein